MTGTAIIVFACSRSYGSGTRPSVDECDHQVAAVRSGRIHHGLVISMHTKRARERAHTNMHITSSQTKPSQAKPTQAKPSQAKPSQAKKMKERLETDEGR